MSRVYEVTLCDGDDERPLKNLASLEFWSVEVYIFHRSGFAYKVASACCP